MLSNFQTYFRLGIQHITDWQAYDHLAFVVALCAVYRPSDWRRLLILVTAFTVGHSLTLALAALRIIAPPAALIEFLIPLTILLTSIFNLFPTKNRGLNRLKYGLALLFGLIHGMGFFAYFSSLLGSASNIVEPLFAFNVGIEVGQLLIVTVVFLLQLFALDVLKISQRLWIIILSSLTACVALSLLLQQM